MRRPTFHAVFSATVLTIAGLAAVFAIVNTVLSYREFVAERAGVEGR